MVDKARIDSIMSSLMEGESGVSTQGRGNVASALEMGGQRLIAKDYNAAIRSYESAALAGSVTGFWQLGQACLARLKDSEAPTDIQDLIVAARVFRFCFLHGDVHRAEAETKLEQIKPWREGFPDLHEADADNDNASYVDYIIASALGNGSLFILTDPDGFYGWFKQDSQFEGDRQKASSAGDNVSLTYRTCVSTLVLQDGLSERHLSELIRDNEPLLREISEENTDVAFQVARHLQHSNPDKARNYFNKVWDGLHGRVEPGQLRRRVEAGVELVKIFLSKNDTANAAAVLQNLLSNSSLRHHYDLYAFEVFRTTDSWPFQDDVLASMRATSSALIQFMDSSMAVQAQRAEDSAAVFTNVARLATYPPALLLPLAQQTPLVAVTVMQHESDFTNLDKDNFPAVRSYVTAAAADGNEHALLAVAQGFLEKALPHKDELGHMHRDPDWKRTNTQVGEMGEHTSAIIMGQFANTDNISLKFAYLLNLALAGDVDKFMANLKAISHDNLDRWLREDTEYRDNFTVLLEVIYRLLLERPTPGEMDEDAMSYVGAMLMQIKLTGGLDLIEADKNQPKPMINMVDPHRRRLIETVGVAPTWRQVPKPVRDANVTPDDTDAELSTSVHGITALPTRPVPVGGEA